LLDVLTDAQKALLPPADEFHDVLAVEWGAYRAFVGMLEQARHPLATELGPFAGVNQPGFLDPVRLANAFMGTSADPARLLALNRAFLKLTLSAKQMGREWPLRAVSSRAHIRAKLSDSFGPAHGFAAPFAGPVSAREVAAGEGETRFMLRHAGRTVRRAELPEREYGTPVEVLEGGRREALTPAAGQALRETTVEVFVARSEPWGLSPRS
jgi:hypothetical protein